MNPILDFYSREDVQKEIARISKNREVAVKFNDKFGKRPDVIQFKNDVLELAKQGATSFHISEEHWKDPLQLEAGMVKRQLDGIRIGWDLIIDIDCKLLEYSKVTAFLLVEALKFHDIKNFSIKFSGGSGFHIGVPFKSFPSSINNVRTKNLFPEAPRAIATYLQEMIRVPLANKITEKTSLLDLSRKIGKVAPSFMKDSKFDPFSFISLDTILISNRHLFRSPYSFHEKSGLVSVPIDKNKVLDFDIYEAKPENVKVKSFLNLSLEKPESKQLLMQALDFQTKQKPIEIKKQTFSIPKINIKPEYFPPCIMLILKGMKQDGRKRALFVLLNFLKNTGYSYEQIKEIIKNWNEKNYTPLKEGYVQAQLNWYKQQNQSILPPNCNNINYYKEIGVCKPDNWCKFIKNPVNYATRKLRIIARNKKK
jgi:hypothetical protein